MLTLIIRDFILSLEDQDDAKYFLSKIEKEIESTKMLKDYCSSLRGHLESDSYHGKKSENVPCGTSREKVSCENESGSDENNGDA